jgi:hypothetical protein
MATGQRCYVEKDSTAPRKDHPTNVMLLSSAAQGADSVRSPTTKAPQELDINFLMARIRPESYVADNDYLTFGSVNKTLFASVLDAVKALRQNRGLP